MKMLQSNFAELTKNNQGYIESVRRFDSKEQVAVYERISRLEEGEHSYSMENQPDRSQEYVREHGWSVHDIYSDPDKTGKNSSRPEFQRMIRDIKAGNITIVVVHRLDRLYRNLSSLLMFIHFLKAHKVRLVSVTEHIELDSVRGKLVIYILGAIAEMYPLQTSTHTRDAKQRRVQSGLTNASYLFCVPTAKIRMARGTARYMAARIASKVKGVTC